MLNTTKLRKKTSKSFRILKEFDNHEMVIGISDSQTKLKGYIAIHSTKLGPALGGTRLQDYPSEEAALRDVLNLSKAMSYKCALAGLPFGGGKAVLIADSQADRQAMLAAYARIVESLRGLFKTGTDMGIFDDDVKQMARHTKHMLGVSKADRGELTTAKMAALGVYYCIKSSLEHVFGNQSVEGKTVGVKGIGKLGGELARLLYEDGAKVVIADTDQAKVKSLLRKYPGMVAVDPSAIHKQSLDIYSPCATGREINSRVLGELKTKIIVGGANNQLADEKIGDKLFNKGIIYAPDYITNAGGLIYVADELEEDGFKKDRVLKRVRGIQATLDEVFDISSSQKVATHRVSDELGYKRIVTGRLG